MAQDKLNRLRDFAARYTAAWCSQHAASVAAFFSPSGSLTINGGVPAIGRSAITEAAQEFMTAFPADPNTLKVQEYLAAHPGYTGALYSVPEVHFPGVISWPFAVALIYTISTFGSIFGGWLPKKFINGGMDANKARKLSMFIFALFPLTVLLASRLGAINTWFAVATIAIA